MGPSAVAPHGLMRAKPDFLPYGEALSALGVEERQLRDLLVQGRLRGFRDAASLKFLRADINALARRLSSRPPRG